MEIISEKEEKIVNMEIDLSEEEMKNLIEIADKSMSKSQLNNLKVEWVIINCLEKMIKNKEFVDNS